VGVDSVVGIAQLGDHAVFLEEPCVDPVGVRRAVAAQEAGGLEGVLVGPEQILDLNPLAAQREVRRVPLVGAAGGGVGREEQVLSEVLQRRVDARDDPGLVQQVRAGGVQDDDVTHDGADASLVGLPEELMLWRDVVEGEVELSTSR